MCSAQRRFIHERFEELVPHHPVADDDNVHHRGFFRLHPGFQLVSRHDFRPANKKAADSIVDARITPLSKSP
jgi:hypothetical protein